ncbi:MAG: WGR domain-containing protein [Candidatus Bipolaricaulia bacterium]
MRKRFLLWKSIDPKENRQRYYSVLLEEDLWGEQRLIQRWGRVGSRPQEKATRVEGDEDLKQQLRRIHRERTAHGYELVDGSENWVKMIKQEQDR